MNSYRKAVDYLYHLQWFGNKLGLENIHWLLDQLDHPHDCYKTIHVAGTNGKGSSAALIASMLQAQGYRVGLYTSPHLIDFSERIRVDDAPISHEDVARLTRKISQLTPSSAPLTPTFFEFTTAMAFLYFADWDVDVAVIEVGMGGRLDATNVVTPIVSLITNIHYDHQIHLGDTLEQIAYEKAGIIKEGIPTVTGTREEKALDVIVRICEERKSPVYRMGTDFTVEGSSPEDFCYQGIQNSWDHLELALEGKYQIKNAGCAVATLEVISKFGLNISEESIRKGLRSVRWEGRLEKMKIPGGPLVYFDGAHNPAGAEALREFLIQVKENCGGSLFLVVGIMKDKDIQSILRPLGSIAERVILTQPDYHRAATVKELEEVIRPMGFPFMLSEDVPDAISKAKNMSVPRDCICITGSLFTVGEARLFISYLLQRIPQMNLMVIMDIGN